MSADAISILRQQFQSAHGWLEATMKDVTPEQARWAPPGRANPLGATFAHILLSEDAMINGMVKGGAPLFATTWAGKTGLSEMPPPPSDAQPWDAWARRVRIDLPALRQYGQAVYAASDECLASLTPDALTRTVDLSAFGMGQESMANFLGSVAAAHVRDHSGEISCLKGLQGARGFPF
jgi:hypothetical protein